MKNKVILSALAGVLLLLGTSCRSTKRSAETVQETESDSLVFQRGLKDALVIRELCFPDTIQVEVPGEKEFVDRVVYRPREVVRRIEVENGLNIELSVENNELKLTLDQKDKLIQRLRTETKTVTVEKEVIKYRIPTWVWVAIAALGAACAFLIKKNFG